MTLAASLTGFEFEVINGVDGKIIPDKALSGVSVCSFAFFRRHTVKPSLLSASQYVLLQRSNTLSLPTISVRCSPNPH